MFQTGWSRVRRVVGPHLSPTPGTARRQINPERSRGTVGGQDLRKAVTKLRQGSGKSVQARCRSHAGQVQRIAPGIEVPVERRRVFATQSQRSGGKLKSAERRNGQQRVMLSVMWVRSRRSD